MVRERWSAKGVALGFAALAAALAFGGAPSTAQSGSSGWELCNQTSFVLEAATGRPDNKAVIVEGWTRLRPGECRAALNGSLKTGVYFVFARSSKAHRGGQREWKGEIPLCIDPNGSFAVENPSSCAAMGLVQRGFQAVRINKPLGSQMTFKEADPYNRATQSAQYAGIQRLLDDAGILAVPVPDGFPNREGRQAITDFLSEHKEPANTSNSALIDMLEEVALNRSLEVGMMLCNRTDKRITAAIARKRPDGWESRGWWVLDANLCVRTVDEGLISVPHYVFAEMETPQGQRTLTGADTPFCTSRARFAILGSENCDKRRYYQAKFVETAVPQDGKLVYEFFDRAFGQPQKKEP